jgi:hypothetical protein
MFTQSAGAGGGFSSTSWGKPTQKKSNWPKVLVALLIVLAIGGYLAWYLLGDVEGGEPLAACAIVIDRTASSTSEATVEQYRDMVERSVDGCAEEQAVLSAYVFDASTSGPELIGEYDLFEPAGRVASKRESQQDAAVNDARDEILEAFDDSTGSDGRGDVLAAYNAAAETLEQHAASEDHVDETFLIMITDGLQLSSGVSVQVLAQPDTSPEDLVDQARDLQSIPAMEGAAVSFAGVGEGVNADGQPLDDAFEARVEDFWRRLTDAAGGSVCSYSNDPGELPGNC